MREEEGRGMDVWRVKEDVVDKDGGNCGRGCATCMLTVRDQMVGRASDFLGPSRRPN
jgi:hypothetical protein